MQADLDRMTQEELREHLRETKERIAPVCRMLCVRVTSEQRSRIKAAAKNSGLSVNRFCVDAALQKCRSLEILQELKTSINYPAGGEH